MLCNCHKTEPLPRCITNLTVGVADTNTDYLVVLKNATGRTDILPITSDSSGSIILTSPDVRIGEFYECYLALPGDVNTKVPFAIGEVEVECLSLKFEYCETTIEDQSVVLI